MRMGQKIMFIFFSVAIGLALISPFSVVAQEWHPGKSFAQPGKISRTQMNINGRSERFSDKEWNNINTSNKWRRNSQRINVSDKQKSRSDRLWKQSDWEWVSSDKNWGYRENEQKRYNQDWEKSGRVSDSSNKYWLREKKFDGKLKLKPSWQEPRIKKIHNKDDNWKQVNWDRNARPPREKGSSPIKKYSPPREKFWDRHPYIPYYPRYNWYWKPYYYDREPYWGWYYPERQWHRPYRKFRFPYERGYYFFKPFCRDGLSGIFDITYCDDGWCLSFRWDNW